MSIHLCIIYEHAYFSINTKRLNRLKWFLTLKSDIGLNLKYALKQKHTVKTLKVHQS